MTKEIERMCVMHILWKGAGHLSKIEGCDISIIQKADGKLLRMHCTKGAYEV